MDLQFKGGGSTIGICGDPALYAPPGAIDGSKSFAIHTVDEFTYGNPKLAGIKDKLAFDGDFDSKEGRALVITALMWGISSDLPADTEHLLWDNLWQKFSAAGLNTQYNIDRTKMKQLVTHFLLGAFSNYSYSAGISVFPQPIRTFYVNNVFSNDYANNGDKWFQAVLWHQFWINVYSQGKADSFKNTIGVIGIPSEFPNNQAIFFQYKKYAVEGKLTLDKISGSPTYTDGNSAYDLTGAVYGVYSDQGLTQKVGELTTNSSGKTNTLTLLEGTYYVKEIKPPKGYTLDATTHTVTVKAS